MSLDMGSLKSGFTERYGSQPTAVVRVPGRVNLIGEHTDYNDGFVLPIAIDRQVVACLARRDDRLVKLSSAQMDADATIDLSGPIGPGEPAWANYSRGVAAGLVDRGVELCGADVLLASDIPLGAGLSSSAALEVCTAMALLAAAGQIDAVPDGDLALLCQRAENEFAGAPCGIMDQSVSVMAQAGHALLLDCRSGEARQIPFDRPGVALLVAETGVRHAIGGGEYGRRRDQCASAARKLGIASLRDADEAMLATVGADGTLDAIEVKRARHVVGEIARTLAAVDALKGGDYDRLGELMCRSHASLRDDFEVSCDELDTIVELARRCGAVAGARMTGGGFGGCAIILADSQGSAAVVDNIRLGFEARFGRPCEVFATRAAAGASVLE